MITIELPEWFVGMLVVLIILKCADIFLGIVITYYEAKLKKAKG